MRMVWLKLYDEILEDRKVQTLSGDAFKFWVNVLAIANRQKVRGVLPPVEDVAFLLRLSVQEATANLAQLVALGILDETPDGLSPHNWAERQRKSDATSTERSRKHREKRDGDATRPQRVPRPSATTGDKNATKCNAQRRERVREENTPLAPKGDEAWVSTNGSDPEPTPKALPSEPVRPPFDDAELTRVGQRAEKLFPMLDFGMKIRGIAGDGPSEFPLSWIDAALTEMHSGDVRNWRYLVGILKRYAADGGPKPSAQSRPRIHNPNPPPPGGQYHRSPATIARLAEQARARAMMESAAS